MPRIVPAAGIPIAFAILAAWAHAEPVAITVDAADTLARRPEPLRYGVCMNYLIDSDRYDPDRKHPIREALRNLKVKAVRWNEGEIGDKMIWSIPPFTTPDVHATHLRTPGTAHYTWRVDDRGKMKRPMELDEAVAIARDLGLELFLIVGIDAIWVEDPAVRGRDGSGVLNPVGKVLKRMTDFPWATPGQSARDMIVAGTAGLARYLAREAADVTVFLEIGNENYLGDADWNPEAYARIVNRLSRVIKDVSPKLRVGAQLSHQHKWTSVAADGRSWNEVMRADLDLDRLDHLIVHQYGYRDTRNLDAGLALLASLPSAQRRRLDLTVTELGTWHTPGSRDRWAPNDLRRSLYQFRWLGMIQTRGKGEVRTPLFWATRWLDALKRGSYEKSFHALTLDGDLTPSGQAIRIWNTFVRDSLVRVTVAGDPKDLYAYASRGAGRPGRLTVWLANNQGAARTAALTLKNVAGARVEAMHRYAGEGPEDRHPEITRVPNPPGLAGGSPPTLRCPLPPFSITVLEVAGG